MNSLNTIGLEKQGCVALIERLNTLLASYQILYMNTRGFHWNVAGADFFEMHLKFEEQYNDLLLKVDEIAERILTLGGTPWHSFSTYIKHSKIDEVTQVTASKAGISHIVDSYSMLIREQREIMTLASELNDEGTTALMGDYIRGQEKLVWMFTAYLR